MTKQEFIDKIRAIKNTRIDKQWGCDPRGILRTIKFILWDVWRGGF